MKARFICLLSAGVLTAMSASAQAPVPGNLWETTTQMNMPGMGMSIPARTSQACVAKASNEPPVSSPPDSNCEMYDVQSVGGKTSWKMRCTGERAMTGEGEIAYQGTDRYSGQMKMSMDGQAMTMNMSGKKIGDCDAGALKREMAATQKQVDQSKAQLCASLVKGMQVQQFDGPAESACDDPKYKADFCKRLSTEEGYDTIAVREKAPGRATTDLEAAGKTCGVNTVAVHSKLCKDAQSGSSLPFLARHCPDEAAPLAQAQCAGRSFTSPPAEKYREFCSTYARHNLMQGSPAGTASDASGSAAGAAQPASSDGKAEAPAPAQDSTVEKSKKALKKMLPF
jgi:hypothetical protein